MPHPARLLAALGGAVALSAALLAARSAPTARLVLAEISCAGAVVLRGSTSDDGSPDADAVWGYLEQLRFAPLDAFADLGVAPTAEKLELLGTPIPGDRPGGRPGHEPDVLLHVAYGGRVELRSLQLERVAADAHGREWRVAPAEIARHFDRRWITRREARLLEKPRRER